MTSEAGGTADRRRSPQSKGDRREQAILDGARELLRTQPVEQLTVDALARAAGISRSSFYFYFDSKQAVLRALLGGLANEAATQADQGWLSASGPRPDLLRAAMATSVQVWRRHGPLLCHAMLGDNVDPALGEFRSRLFDGYVGRAAARIRRDQAAGLIGDAPPAPEDLAAMMFWVEVRALGTATRPGAKTGAAVDAYLADSLTNVKLRLLYGAPGPAGWS